MRNNHTLIWFYTHAPNLTAHTDTHLHKILPRAHYTPIHTHKIIHTMILLQTHLHKIPPHAHHTPLHTQIIIHTKILTSQPITHTRKYYLYKKLSQYQKLPHLWRNTLIKCRIRNVSWYGTTWYGLLQPFTCRDES